MSDKDSCLGRRGAETHSQHHSWHMRLRGWGRGVGAGWFCVLRPASCFEKGTPAKPRSPQQW